MIEIQIPPRLIGTVLAVIGAISVATTIRAWSQDDHPLPPAASDARVVLHAAQLVYDLEIAPEASHDSYDRDRFGNGWATQDDCTTRQRVLRDESVLDPAMTGDCAVIAGRWESWYDARTHTDPASLDIDHLVPLAEAWASGAAAWSDQQREAFANDLDRPDALVAVTAETNRSKGDADPAEWMPPDRTGWCRYVAGWVTQKHAWDLTTDPAEQRRVVTVLKDCTAGGGQS